MKNHLKKGDKIYKITKAGLILQIVTILGTTEDLAMSQKHSFVKEYESKVIKCVDSKATNIYFNIETEKLKKRWHKQMVFMEIMLLLDANLELSVLEDILKLLKI